MDRNVIITARVKNLMAAQGLIQADVVRRSGIGQGNMSKKLSGKRPWSKEDYPKLAKAFGVDPGYFISDLPEEIDTITYNYPIVAEWRLAGFDHRLICAETPLGYAKLLRLRGEPMPKGVYGIRIKPDDNSLAPIYPAGSTIIVEQGSSEKILESDNVVFHDQDGMVKIYTVHFENDSDFIRLESLNPKIPSLRVASHYKDKMDLITGYYLRR